MTTKLNRNKEVKIEEKVIKKHMYSFNNIRSELKTKSRDSHKLFFFTDAFFWPTFLPPFYDFLPLLFDCFIRIGLTTENIAVFFVKIQAVREGKSREYM